MSKVYLEFLTQIGDEKLKQVKKCKIQQYRVLQMQPQKHWVEGSLPTACHLCSDQCSTACGWPSPRGLTSDSSSMSCLWSPLLQICFLSSQCPGCTDAWYFPIPPFAFGELHEVSVHEDSSSLSMSLSKTTVLQHTDCSSHLGVICKLAEGVFHPIIYVIDAHVKWFWPRYQSLGNIVHN